MGLLDGKTALITGASKGIGKAIALAFASEGADIAFTDVVVNEDTVSEIAALIREQEKEPLKKGGMCYIYMGIVRY